jgi:hypothetical protein
LTSVREIARIANLEDKTAGAYDSAVREFTNGQMTIKELVALIERSILPELRAAQTRLSQLQHVPREQAKLVADADQYSSCVRKAGRHGLPASGGPV